MFYYNVSKQSSNADPQKSSFNKSNFSINVNNHRFPLFRLSSILVAVKTS